MGALTANRASATPLTEVADTVTDVLGEAWSSGSQLARELAAAAAERASDLGSTAAAQVSGASDAVVDVVGKARDRVHPTPKRRWNPWFLVIAAAVAFVATGWWLRQRRQRTADEASTLNDPSPIGTYRAAAGG